MNKKYQCLNCKKEFIANVCEGGHQGKYCSLFCYHRHRIGKPNEKYRKRPGYLISQGYQWIRVPIDYNGGFTRGLKGHKYLQEHRFVAEKMLGRPLTKNEVVHHINFNPLDNRPDNLIVLTRKFHRQLEWKLAKGYMEILLHGRNNPKEVLKRLFPDLEIT